MSTLKWLSRKEEFVLLAIESLGEDAYGISIRGYLSEMTDKFWSIGATYDVLDRLARKKCINAHVSAPTPERGGKGKKLYNITERGLRELESIKELNQAMWSGFLSPAHGTGDA